MQAVGARRAGRVCELPAASPAAAAAAVPPAALGADGAPAVAIEVHALHWSLRPPRQEAH